MKLAIAVVALLAACGGGPKQAPPPAVPTGPATPAPPSCPGVVYACTDPAVGCFEGGQDFKDAMSADCKKGGGTESGHCDPTGTLGSCTVVGKLAPTFAGCGTTWIKAGQLIQTPDDGKAQCAKAGGTWTTSH